MNSKPPYRKLELTEAMRVGDPAIDDEHRGLIGIINKIVIAHNEGKLDDCRGLVLHFADLMKEHFRREEDFLEEACFGRLDEHRKHHLDIEVDIETISQDLMGNIGDEKTWVDFYQRLVSIMVDDAVKADMDFKSFLADKRN